MNPMKGFEGKRGGEFGVTKRADSRFVFTSLRKNSLPGEREPVLPGLELSAGGR